MACQTFKECETLYKSISEELKKPALELLKKKIKFVACPGTIGFIRLTMMVDIELRNAGFDEEYFGIYRLTDIALLFAQEL